MIPIFQWMAWGNIFKYAGEILVANEFHGLKLSCDNNGRNGKHFHGVLELFYSIIILTLIIQYKSANNEKGL